jgi:uncharacterized membrane protein YqjE
MDETGQNPPPDGGLSRGLRRILVTLLSTLQNRVELLGVELQEEREWFIATLIWAAVLVFLGGCTVTLVAVAIVFLCPPEVRPHVLVALCLVFLAVSIGMAVGLRKRLREKPPAFGETISELKKDLSELRPSD